MNKPESPAQISDEPNPLLIDCEFCHSRPYYGCINASTQKPMPFYHMARIRDARSRLEPVEPIPPPVEAAKDNNTTCTHCGGDLTKNYRCSNGGYCVSIADVERAAREPVEAVSTTDKCGECGESIPLDTVLFKEDWEDMGGDGLLCPSCIVKRISKLDGAVGAQIIPLFSHDFSSVKEHPCGRMHVTKLNSSCPLCRVESVSTTPVMCRDHEWLDFEGKPCPYCIPKQSTPLPQQDTTKVLGCDYQGHEFGASYPDSVCIEGSLHDADNCNSEGQIYLQEEDIPCPMCRPEDAIEWHKGRGNEHAALLVADIRNNRGIGAAIPQQEEPAKGPVKSRFMAIMNSIKDEEADYLIGRCIPLLQILLHEGNEQAKEVLDEIKAYCAE